MVHCPTCSEATVAAIERDVAVVLLRNHHLAGDADAPEPLMHSVLMETAAPFGNDVGAAAVTTSARNGRGGTERTTGAGAQQEAHNGRILPASIVLGNAESTLLRVRDELQDFDTAAEDANAAGSCYRCMVHHGRAPTLLSHVFLSCVDEHDAPSLRLKLLKNPAGNKIPEYHDLVNGGVRIPDRFLGETVEEATGRAGEIALLAAREIVFNEIVFGLIPEVLDGRNALKLRKQNFEKRWGKCALTAEERVARMVEESSAEESENGNFVGARRFRRVQQFLAGEEVVGDEEEEEVSRRYVTWSEEGVIRITGGEEERRREDDVFSEGPLAPGSTWLDARLDAITKKATGSSPPQEEVLTFERAQNRLRMCHDRQLRYDLELAAGRELLRLDEQCLIQTVFKKNGRVIERANLKLQAAAARGEAVQDPQPIPKVFAHVGHVFRDQLKKIDYLEVNESVVRSSHAGFASTSILDCLGERAEEEGLRLGQVHADHSLLANCIACGYWKTALAMLQTGVAPDLLLADADLRHCTREHAKQLMPDDQRGHGGYGANMLLLFGAWIAVRGGLPKENLGSSLFEEVSQWSSLTSFFHHRGCGASDEDPNLLFAGRVGWNGRLTLGWQLAAGGLRLSTPLHAAVLIYLCREAWTRMAFRKTISRLYGIGGEALGLLRGWMSDRRGSSTAPSTKVGFVLNLTDLEALRSRVEKLATKIAVLADSLAKHQTKDFSRNAATRVVYSYGAARCHSAGKPYNPHASDGVRAKTKHVPIAISRRQNPYDFPRRSRYNYEERDRRYISTLKHLNKYHQRETYAGRNLTQTKTSKQAARAFDDFVPRESIEEYQVVVSRQVRVGQSNKPAARGKYLQCCVSI